MNTWSNVACAGAVVALFAAEAVAQVPENPEPNDSPVTATVLTCSAQGYGHLDPTILGGDVDYWSFTTTAPVELRVFVSGRGGGASSLLDARLLLLTGDGAAVVATNSDYSGREPSLIGSMPRVRIASLAADTYQLVVAGQGVLDAGDYAIDIRCAPPATGVGCSGGLLAEFELEPNDAPLSASPLIGDGCSDVAGSISAIGDVDCYRFTITQPARLRLAVDPRSPLGLPLTDPVCELLTMDGAAVLGVDDDDGPNLASLLEAVVAPTSYLVCVRGFGASIGDYSLRIEMTPFPGDPPVLAGTESTGQGCLGSSGERLTLSLRANEWPQLGTTWTCDAVGLAPGMNGFVFGFLGLFPYPTPIDLAPVGAPGCLLLFPEAIAIPFVPTRPSEAEISLPIPNSLPQLGLDLLLQAIAVDLPSSALGVTTSNLIRIRIGDDA